MQPARFDLIERLAVARLDDGVEDPASDENVRFANAFFGNDPTAADREICGRD
jgi:hypothetical protein